MQGVSLSLRLGAQVPQLWCSPPDVVDVDRARVAVEWAARFELCDGFALDGSQEWRLRNALGRRADGRWAAPTVADFGGRQGAGKTADMEAREGAGLCEFGEMLLIHSAHEFPTANESFLKMASLFTEWDELRCKVKKIRFANGEQAIWLTNGARLLYKARTGGSGRGYRKADFLGYDEAQHITAEHVGASGPTRLANKNPQSWYAGSGGFSTSVQAWKLRRLAMRAMAGLAAPRLAYSEFTAQKWKLDADGKVQLENPDPADRDAWAAGNPGFGRWVPEEGMETLHDELTDDVFLREILCCWEPDPGDMVGVALPNWSVLEDARSSVASHDQWALAVSPDRSFSAIGVAGRDRAGRLHVEVWRSEAGTDWVEDAIVAKYEQKKRLPLRIHQAGPESSFIVPLRARGVEVVEVSTGDVARATGNVLDAAANSRLSHLGQPELDRAVSSAILRTTPEGAAIWWRKLAGAELSPLVAVTVAAGAVPAEVRRPRIH